MAVEIGDQNLEQKIYIKMFKSSWYKKQRNILYKNNYNYDYYFYYYYYSHLFGSLVKHGKKLWAFNFLVKVNYELKKKEGISPHILYILV